MMKRSLIVVAVVAAASLGWSARQEAGVKATFEKFVAAQNAHDVSALESLLSDSPTFLWITRGTAVWGRADTIARFKSLYAGTWQLEPDLGAFKVIAANDRMAEIFVPIRFTMGAAGETPQKTLFYMNQVLVKEGADWKVASILPIPVAAPNPPPSGGR